MGESIKFAIAYTTPFLEGAKLLRNAIQSNSIIQEMYDHTSFDHSSFAFEGFLNAGTYFLEERQKKNHQLTTFFGPRAITMFPIMKVWRKSL
jgi:hypothetical protein